MNNYYVYRGLRKKINDKEWHELTNRPYKMKHHAKLNFPSDAVWIPEERFWACSRGYCYKVQRTGPVWEDVE